MRMRAGSLLLLALAFANACTGGEKESNSAKPKQDRWTVPGEPPLRELVRTGAFGDSRLTEASGVAASVTEPGVFWSQNDRGNAATLYAYDSTGVSLGTVRVRGAENTDWEAIALGPCANGLCLYIGDVGDNYAARAEVRVWRVAAPVTSARDTEAPASLRIVYPGGARDVEAMWVAPDTSLWFATKRPNPDASGQLRASQLYRVAAAAWSVNAVATAEWIDSLPIVPGTSVSRDWVTDASLSAVMPGGRRRLAILTYGSVYVFDADPVTGRPGAQMARCAVPPGERNAEGVTWLPDGRLMLVNEGRGAKLYRGHCPGADLLGR
ncbi:hypothetical protein [Gemmatimonas groenlandica]|uniref:Uncharacterized protein n=1 Tax=Gemmatimonas groenlandica TaxID=2732249 RepID=A0A6M4IQD5_9BACT|nr:hypothetical protein [Gemmatimonas groenlandica]QJR35969.1 hypothetical protein HKW67_10870 [Gemmatimonas groenlandica]